MKKKKFVNDEEEYIGTTGCRLSSVPCAVQLKDQCGMVGVASDKKPSIIPAKGGRKTKDQSDGHLSTHNPVMGGELYFSSQTKTKVYVFVLNKHGLPLMPCSPARAKKLLKSGKAKVVKTNVFTIKLLGGSAGYKQNIVAGMDSGSKNLATSAVTNGKVVYQSQTQLRINVHSKMEQRAMYRRNRRGRKTRYRKPRFNNRKRSDGWLAPSVLSKVNSHLREKGFMESILPITYWKVELAAFDIHKINNLSVSGVEYQNGSQKDFYNTKQYVLFRDGFVCQHCKGKSKDKKLQVHHVVYRSNGGTNEPNNLMTLCETCHKKVHDEDLLLKKSAKRKSTKDATQVSIICSALKKIGWIFEETFGYETKFKREILNLPKEHYYDAVAIALEDGELVENLDYVFFKKHVSKGDYQFRNGKRSEKIIPIRL